MSTNAQESPMAGFRLEDFLPYKLVIVTDGVSRIFAGNFLESFNLTIPEWRILAVVAEQGTLSPTATAARTAMDKVKVSRAAQSLAAKGLLRQSADPSDGRGRLLRLTRKGNTTHAAIVPLATRLESTLFDDLSRADMAALNRVLTKIAARVEMIGASAEDGEE